MTTVVPSRTRVPPEGDWSMTVPGSSSDLLGDRGHVEPGVLEGGRCRGLAVADDVGHLHLAGAHRQDDRRADVDKRSPGRVGADDRPRCLVGVHRPRVDQQALCLHLVDGALLREPDDVRHLDLFGTGGDDQGHRRTLLGLGVSKRVLRKNGVLLLLTRLGLDLNLEPERPRPRSVPSSAFRR